MSESFYSTKLTTTPFISDPFYFASRHRHARRPLMVFDSRPNEPVTLFQQQKIVTRKCRSLLKFLTAQKSLFYGRQPRCRYKCVPPTFAQMTSLSFAPKISLFVLKLYMRKGSGGATKALAALTGIIRAKKPLCFLW